jgi:hypothetical protein
MTPEALDQCPDEHDGPNPTFEDHHRALANLYRSKDGEIRRLHEVLQTLLINALKNPTSITADLVAFVCDAALKNYTIHRALEKWDAHLVREDVRPGVAE